jgi:RHS repeat-associated protein
MIHPKHLNTPRQVYDDQQQLRWKWDPAEPFENNPADENPSGLGVFDLPLRLPGQRYDAETALHYNYFRDFDPSLGMYKQSDPIGLRGGTNTYLYVAGSPLRFFDSDGLIKLPIDPSGLPSDWTPDPSHRDPNGERWRHPSGDFLDFNRGRPGMPGWRGKDHWHHNGGEKHLPPGSEVPDPPGGEASSCPNNNCQSKVATIVVGAAGAYVIYRCIRPIPSLLPPLWWTIPPNVAAP